MLALAALAGLLTGSTVLPIGPNGGFHLALDPLSALFLLVVCVSGAAAALVSNTPLLPVAIAALALALVAADGFTLVLALGSASLAAWALNPSDRPGLAWAACGTVFLAAALLLLAPQDIGLELRFTAIRAAPPEAARASAALLLALLSAGSCMTWMSRPGQASALLSRSLAAVAAYPLVRVLLDLCGPAVPGWWGLPLLVLGAAGTVLGGLRANAEDDLLAILAAARMGSAGLITAGLGVAVAARASDLVSLAALALAGALLQATSYAVFDTLLSLCAAAVARAAGSGTLSELGGLIRTMPGVALGALAGAACLAGLPLTAGFTGRWLLVQSLLISQHTGGIAAQIVLALVLAAIALGAALAVAAAVRLVGIALLGRARTPHAAAAVDATRPLRVAVAALAACCLLLGVWPAAGLALVQPAVRQLLAASFGGGGLLIISPQVDSPGYAAPGILVVLAICGMAASYALSRIAVRRPRRVPRWSGGHDDAPARHPGDPATQYSAASAGRTVLQSVGDPLQWSGLRRLAKAARGRIDRSMQKRSAGALLLALAALLLWAAR